MAAVLDTSIDGARVARELDRIAELQDILCLLVKDSGTEVTSDAILKWHEDCKIGWRYIASVTPMQSGLISASTGGCGRNA